MASILKTYIACDGCGARYAHRKEATTVKQRRIDASGDGWARNGFNDFCPACREKHNKPQEELPEETNGFFNSDNYLRNTATL